MNILRLSTLSLTLAIAVFALGYVNPSSAAKPGACLGDPPLHPSCKDDPVSSITHTAQLLGAFVFGVPDPLDVVLEGQDLILRSDNLVTILRPTDSFAATWDNVFEFCDLLDDNPLPGGFIALAGKKGWTIERPGGVAVRFRNIGTFPSSAGDVDVTLDLIGDCACSGGTEFCQPFPPEAGNTSSIPLISYRIHARGQPGLNSECHGERAFFGVDQESTLLITAPP